MNAQTQQDKAGPGHSPRGQVRRDPLFMACVAGLAAAMLAAPAGAGAGQKSAETCKTGGVVKSLEVLSGSHVFVTLDNKRSYLLGLRTPLGETQDASRIILGPAKICKELDGQLEIQTVKGSRSVATLTVQAVRDESEARALLPDLVGAY